MKSSFFP